MNNTDDLITLSHKLSPFVVGMEGNVSFRLDNNFYIKKSGASLKYLTKNDIVKCNIYGESLELTKTPSMEVDFHSWLYQNTEYKYIAHTHPTNTLKILSINKLTDKFANKRLFPDQVILNGEKSCIIKYSHPGTKLKDKISFGINKFIQKNNFFPKIILLENHGIIVCGHNINECIYSTEICEKSAEIFFDIHFKNEKFVNYLSKKQIKELTKDKKEIFRLNNLSHS